MRNFNQNNKFGGQRDFSRNDRQMYRTVCANCGKNCEVPFKPTGSKPVYCNDCFRESKGNDNYSPNRYQERPRYEERNFEQRNFERGPKNADTFQYKQHFDALNTKLDKIISLLTPVVTPKEKVMAKIDEVKEEAPKKKKPVTKKTVKK